MAGTHLSKVLEVVGLDVVAQITHGLPLAFITDTRKHMNSSWWRLGCT
jgi:hypothetical protein